MSLGLGSVLVQSQTSRAESNDQMLMFVNDEGIPQLRLVYWCIIQKLLGLIIVVIMINHSIWCKIQWRECAHKMFFAYTET